VTARLTGVPWYEEGGRRVLHLGAAVSLRDPDDTVRYNPRPEAHLSTVRFVDTLPFSVTETRIYDGEIAVVYGPFSAQGEYARVEADLRAGGSETFSGYYAMASYFLTGEHRPYSRSTGAFGRIRPNRNFGFGESKGPGAWELALRISKIDLNDSTIRGGEEDNLTLGLNWYLNPNMRLMFNYTHADVDHDSYEGDVNVLQSRLQVDF